MMPRERTNEMKVVLRAFRHAEAALASPSDTQFDSIYRASEVIDSLSSLPEMVEFSPLGNVPEYGTMTNTPKFESQTVRPEKAKRIRAQSVSRGSVDSIVSPVATGRENIFDSSFGNGALSRTAEQSHVPASNSNPRLVDGDEADMLRNRAESKNLLGDIGALPTPISRSALSGHNAESSLNTEPDNGEYDPADGISILRQIVESVIERQSTASDDASKVSGLPRQSRGRDLGVTRNAVSERTEVYHSSPSPVISSKATQDDARLDDNTLVESVPQTFPAQTAEQGYFPEATRLMETLTDQILSASESGGAVRSSNQRRRRLSPSSSIESKHQPLGQMKDYVGAAQRQDSDRNSRQGQNRPSNIAPPAHQNTGETIDLEQSTVDNFDRLLARFGDVGELLDETNRNQPGPKNSVSDESVGNGTRVSPIHDALLDMRGGQAADSIPNKWLDDPMQNDAITSIVNNALVEQARRNGVDLT